MMTLLFHKLVNRSEYIENEHFATEGMNNMSLLENNDENVMLSQCYDVFEVMENNEENVSLSRCYDDFERTGFADLDDILHFRS